MCTFTEPLIMFDIQSKRKDTLINHKHLGLVTICNAVVCFDKFGRMWVFITLL